MTAMIYLEGSTGSAWTDSTGTAYMWDNVLLGSLDVPNSNVYISTGTGHQFLNNTLIVAAPNGGGSWFLSGRDQCHGRKQCDRGLQCPHKFIDRDVLQHD